MGAGVELGDPTREDRKIQTHRTCGSGAAAGTQSCSDHAKSDTNRVYRSIRGGYRSEVRPGGSKIAETIDASCTDARDMSHACAADHESHAKSALATLRENVGTVKRMHNKNPRKW